MYLIPEGWYEGRKLLGPADAGSKVVGGVRVSRPLTSATNDFQHAGTELICYAVEQRPVKIIVVVRHALEVFDGLPLAHVCVPPFLLIVPRGPLPDVETDGVLTRQRLAVELQQGVAQVRHRRDAQAARRPPL